jgi:hypothetical protein
MVGWLLGVGLVLLPVVTGVLGVPASADCAPGDPSCLPAPSLPPPPSAPAGNDVAAAAQLLALINADRAAASLPLLSPRDDVTAIAVEWSTTMAAAQDIAHNDAYFTADTRRRLGARTLGENVAMNRSTYDAHQRLMASPGHHANLVNPKFTVVGLAVVRDGGGIGYITEDFVEPAPAGSSSAPPPSSGGGDSGASPPTANHPATVALPASSAAALASAAVATPDRTTAASPSPASTTAADSLPTDPATTGADAGTSDAAHPNELARGLGPSGPTDTADTHVPLWLALLAAAAVALTAARLRSGRRSAR